MSKMRTNYKKLLVKMLKLRKSRAKIDTINLAKIKLDDPKGYKQQLIKIIESPNLCKKLSSMDYTEVDYRALIDLLNELQAYTLAQFVRDSALFEKKPDKELIDLLGGRLPAYRILNKLATIDRTTVQHWYTGRSKMPSAWRILILLIILS